MASDSQDEDINLRTILEAVKKQGENIEAIVDAKVSEKMDILRDEIQGTNQCMKSQVKKMKTESQYKWRSEGNKIQFTGNTENLEDLTQALWALDHRKDDYARDLISACIDRLKHRNKLIKIADSSDGGWDTARQYDANPIASDSEDESKIIRADNRAMRKRKQKSKAKSKPSATVSAPRYVESPPFRGGQPSWDTNYPLTQGIYAGKPSRGPCYNCGSYKHWRARCPFPDNKTGDKQKGN